MKDKLVKILLSKLSQGNWQAGKVKKDIEDGYMAEDERVIPIQMVIDMICDIDQKVQDENKFLIPKTKFLYVEDGSVDVDALAEDLFITNPEIKVIVYRQGSHPPILTDRSSYER